METKIVYFDESGDNGRLNSSSPYFILTSVSMDASDWKENYLLYKQVRKSLRSNYGLYTYEEIHMKNYLYDHDPYRKYGLSPTDRRKLLIDYIHGLVNLSMEAINVVIDKTVIRDNDYPILENALKYNIQRIDNTYSKQYNYLIITDKGRLSSMRKTARAICAYNQIPSSVPGFPSKNVPIKGMIEDILEKDSVESPFIQIADTISYFVNLYYRVIIKDEQLSGRVASILSANDLIDIMDRFKENSILNLRASGKDPYGLVIYPSSR